jgi:hypothetical protein
MVNLKRFQFWGRNPLTIVEFLLGIASILSGLYVVTPLQAYATITQGATPLVATLGSPIALFVFGALLGLSGLFMLIGIFRRNYRIRVNALFVNILCRFYSVTVTVMVGGLLPPLWLPPLTILFITVVCYLVARGMTFAGGGK